MLIWDDADHAYEYKSSYGTLSPCKHKISMSIRLLMSKIPYDYLLSYDFKVPSDYTASCDCTIPDEYDS